MESPVPFPFAPPPALDEEPELALLREQRPVCPVRAPYGGPARLITRHADVRSVLGDPRFGRAATARPDVARLLPEPASEGLLQSLDPPEHRRVRSTVQKAFTGRRVAALRPRVVRIAEDLVDAVVAAGPHADLVSAVATPLPVAVVGELLGVPDVERAALRRWSSALMSTTPAAPGQRADAHRELLAMFSDLIRERRADPRDDLLSALVAAHDDDQRRLAHDEVVALASDILLAGHETTAAALADSVYVLLTRGGLEALGPDEATTATAVEELLRFVPLGAGAARTRVAHEEVDLDGVRVEAGTAVFALTTSANRDPRVFERPEDLDLARTPNPHLAFGHGIHHCLGAPLARLQLVVALQVLRDRLPALRLAVPPSQVPWRSGALVRTPARLMVHW